MSSKGITTADLIALTREMSTLVTRDVVTTFNKAAAKEQKDVMKVMLQDEAALRKEAKRNPRLMSVYNRLLCLNILERIDYGMQVVFESAPPLTVRQLHQRAAGLNGQSNVNNADRADILETVGAPRLASLIRQYS